MDQLLLPGQCQYDGCTHRVNSNSSGRFCFTHGGQHVCSHTSCSKFVQAGGQCIKHGYKKPAAWMNAVIRVLHIDFAKDMEATIVAMSSIVQITYSARICADFIIL